MPRGAPPGSSRQQRRVLEEIVQGAQGWVLQPPGMDHSCLTETTRQANRTTGFHVVRSSLGLGTAAALSRGGEPLMSSSWPILVGMFAVVFAAFWYDAAVAAAGAAQSSAPQ